MALYACGRYDEDQTADLLQRITGISREKARLLYEVACQERSYMDSDDTEVNIYIGIPFCASRCLYCSFTSYPIERLSSLVDPYLDALSKEMEFGSQWIKDNNLRINSLYIGGGTLPHCRITSLPGCCPWFRSISATRSLP